MRMAGPGRTRGITANIDNVLAVFPICLVSSETRPAMVGAVNGESSVMNFRFLARQRAGWAGCGDWLGPGAHGRTPALGGRHRWTRCRHRRGGSRCGGVQPGHPCRPWQTPARTGSRHRGGRWRRRGHPRCSIAARAAEPRSFPRSRSSIASSACRRPGNAVTDAQILRTSRKDVTSMTSSLSACRGGASMRRIRLLQQAGVNVRMLDVEAACAAERRDTPDRARSRGASGPPDVGQQNSVLCLFSEQGPVVARYLDVGAQSFLRPAPVGVSRVRLLDRRARQAIATPRPPKAEAACREIVERMAEDIRLSLTFYRTEYDRESLPRYAIGGSVDLPQISRWVADRLGLGAPLEMMDPFRALEVKAPQTQADTERVGATVPPGLRAGVERTMSTRFRVDLLHPGEDLRQIVWVGQGLGGVAQRPRAARGGSMLFALGASRCWSSSSSRGSCRRTGASGAI